MIHVVSKAPTRIDIAGGTIDLWPIHHVIEKKCTINAGISVWVTTEICPSEDQQYHLSSVDQNTTISGSYDEICKNQNLSLLTTLFGELWHKDLGPVRVTTNSQSPKGAGLGGSSAVAACFVSALDYVRSTMEKKERMSEAEVVALTCNAEAKILHTPTGGQDQWGALRGRINLIRYPLSGPQVETIAPDDFSEFNDSLLVCYSGQSRNSATNNWEIYKKAMGGDEATVKLMSEIGRISEDCAAAVANRDWKQVLECSKEDWAVRKSICPQVETDVTKGLERVAFENGAYFSRVCGAGGGGVMSFFCPPDKRSYIAAKLNEAGGSVLDASITDTGLTIEEL